MEEKLKALESLPWVESIAVYANCIQVRLREGKPLTFDLLQQFSLLFDTTLIDVVYHEETGDHSEYTPGDPSDFYVVIRGVRVSKWLTETWVKW